MKDKVVFLDEGHGAINPSTGRYVTPGKRSLREVDGDWLYEGVSNRLIGYEVKQALELNNYKVIKVAHEWEDTPLSERIIKVNDLYKKYSDAVLISIHSNGHTNESANGYEIFTHTNASKRSDLLADEWLKEFSKLSDQRNRGHKKANFAMLRVKPPAVLLEVAFHTNPEEVRLLRDWRFRVKVSTATLKSLETYFNQNI